MQVRNVNIRTNTKEVTAQKCSSIPMHLGRLHRFFFLQYVRRIYWEKIENLKKKKKTVGMSFCNTANWYL